MALYSEGYQHNLFHNLCHNSFISIILMLNFWIYIVHLKISGGISNPWFRFPVRPLLHVTKLSLLLRFTKHTHQDSQIYKIFTVIFLVFKRFIPFALAYNLVNNLFSIGSNFSSTGLLTQFYIFLFLRVGMNKLCLLDFIGPLSLNIWTPSEL